MLLLGHTVKTIVEFTPIDKSLQVKTEEAERFCPSFRRSYVRLFNKSDTFHTMIL